MEKYYHGSHLPLKTGRKIRIHAKALVMSDKPSIRTTEQIFENARQRMMPDALPRNQSVYITDTPDLFPLWRVGSHLHHVHEVEPAGPVERGHAGWWTLVNLHHDEDGFEAQVMRWAEAYWAGEECSREHPLAGDLKHTPASFPGAWEYRCPAFQVVRDHGPAEQRIGPSTVRFDGGRCLMLEIPGSSDVEDLLGKPVSCGESWYYNMPFLADRAAWLERCLLKLFPAKDGPDEDPENEPGAAIVLGQTR